jgi:D-glucuronyl C5-epimerase-like protein
MRALLFSLALLGTSLFATSPLPHAEATAKPATVQADTGPNASLEPDEQPGIAVPPPDPAEVERKLHAPVPRVARPPLTGYFRAPDAPRVLPVGRRPYDTQEITPPEGFGLVDDQGVRMFRVKGSSTLYDHPVAQGRYAVENLNSYRLTGNPAYLHIAIKNAQRLVDRRVLSDGAWYFPYAFDFAPLGDASEILRAPWYSGMAQGRALSVFVRLYEVTGDPRWRTAADAAFTSLVQAPSGGLPYGSFVDSGRHVWLETYPRFPAANGEKVLNGHVASLWGVLDYWMLTRSALALQLAKGAIATVKATAPATNGFRRVGGSSIYSLRHRTLANSYHQTHVEQFLQLWQFTDDTLFITTANSYRGDYPKPATSGTMRATPRTSTIYQVNSAMRVVRTSRVHFGRITHAPADHRQRITGGPIALHVSKGPYTNWWFPEAYGTTWLLGATDTHGYAPDAHVRIAPGTYTAYRLDTTGDIAGGKSVTFHSASGAPTAVSGVVQGRQAYYIAAGTYAGYWLPMVRGISITA